MYAQIHERTRNGETYWLVYGRTTVWNKKKKCYRKVTYVKYRARSREELALICALIEGRLGGVDLQQPSLERGWRQGRSYGALYVFDKLAERMGLKRILGTSRKGLRVLGMVYGKLLGYHSRRELQRAQERYGFEEVLGVRLGSDDTLYRAMDWLEGQSEVLYGLWERNHRSDNERIFLYDVTSSYLEGTKNAYADYGYNRDGKKGKKQVVVGLLTDQDGFPIGVEVYRGNTADTETIDEPLDAIVNRFPGQSCLVADKGMLRGPQQERMRALNMDFITTISRGEMRKLAARGVFQPPLFGEKIREVVDESKGLRYIYRRNSEVAQYAGRNRREREELLKTRVEKANQYLFDHPKAKVKTQLQRLRTYAEKAKLAGYITVTSAGRKVFYTCDETARKAVEAWDGCYVIKTTISRDEMDMKTVHSAYKRLQCVEQDFRTLKGPLCALRPFFVRKKDRTRAHIMVTVLALAIIQMLRRLLKDSPFECKEVIDSLSQYCFWEYTAHGLTLRGLPAPDAILKQIFETLDISVPERIVKTPSPPSRSSIRRTKRHTPS